MPKLSIIIVNWNTAKLLSDCLKSLEFEIRSAKSAVETEIIVVDNGSTDCSVEVLKNPLILNSKFKILLIENQENLGFAKGNNIGIKQAMGEYIMLLNTDTIIKEGAIEKLVEFLDEQPESVAAVSPLVLNSDDTIQKDPCYLKFPSPIFVLFCYNPILKKIALKFFPKFLFSETNFSKITEIDQLPGAAIMIRKKVLDKIGLFDEKYQIYFEDSDLCMRIKKAGYKMFLEPTAEIIHLGRQSIKPIIEKEGLEKFYFLNFKSLFYFCRKHYSFVKYQLIRWELLLQFLLTLKFKLFKKLLFVK